MSSENRTPVIIIPGFGQSKAALYDKDGNFEKQVWPLRFDMKELAKQIIKPYIKSVILRKDKGFTDTAFNMYTTAFEPFACNEHGRQKHDLRAIEYSVSLSQMTEKVKGYVCKLVPVTKLAEKIGEDRIFFFAYNAFSSPYETAEKLKNFISAVKENCNSEKVSLLSFSMGGSVLTAYFDAYSKETDIEKVFFLCSALSGSVLQADIMNNNIDKKQGYSLLGFISNNSTVDSFKKALSVTTWDTRYRLLYRSLDAVRESIFINSPGMWALMPPEQYPQLVKDFISDEKHRELLKLTDRFYNAQKNIRSILSEQKNRGVEIHICAGYGLHIMPLSASQNISTDGILPLPSSSLGATASFGEKPDISGLLFPDTTYLYEGLAHSDGVKNETVQQLVADCLG